MQTQANVSVGLRLEWVKARARKLRWQEELELLPEEVRRSILFFNHKAKEWEQRSLRREASISPEVLEGLIGYARRQAHLMRQLALSGQQRWTKITRVPLVGIAPLPRRPVTEDINVCNAGTNPPSNSRGIRIRRSGVEIVGRDDIEAAEDAEGAENEENADDEERGDEEDDNCGPDDSDTEEVEEEENNYAAWLERGVTD